MIDFISNLFPFDYPAAIIRFGLSLVLLFIAFLFDIQTEKIPNYITLPACLVGIILSGIFTPQEFPVKFLFFVILLFVGILLPIMGAGDIKLLMALLFLSGVFETLICLLLASIIMLIAFCIRKPADTIRDIKDAFFAIITFRVGKISTGQKAPFAGYLAVGFYLEFVLAVCLRGHF